MFKNSVYIMSPNTALTKACHVTEPKLNSMGKISHSGSGKYLLNNKLHYIKKMAFKILKKPSSEGWDK